MARRLRLREVCVRFRMVHVKSGSEKVYLHLD